MTNSKPTAGYSALASEHAFATPASSTVVTNGGVLPAPSRMATAISYRNLPLPRYHLDPVLENGLATDSDKASKLIGVIDSSMYVRHYQPVQAGQELLFRCNTIENDRDRHNDSGYSTRPGESSQGPSPSLSGNSQAPSPYLDLNLYQRIYKQDQLNLWKGMQPS